MKKIIFIFLLSISIYAQNLETLLNQKLNDLYISENVVGVSSAISIEGSIVWKGAEGFSDPNQNIPIDTNMIFGIASITKMFTSAMILRLVEQNKLSLSDKISTWIIPSEKIDGNITVHELLNHTSGINNFTTDAWVASYQAEPYKIWTPNEVIDTFVELPLFVHGTNWSYSNTNYLLLGMIIEKIEFQTYAEVLRTMLNELNLPSMYIPPFESTNGPSAIPWFDINNDGVDDNLFNFSMNSVNTSAWAAGAIFSTAEHLAQWGFKLFNNEVIG